MHTSSDTTLYRIGIDGGGTKTLVRVFDAENRELAHATGPGSALRNGAVQAWAAVMQGIEQAFTSIDMAVPPLSQLAVGMGVAGFNVTQWAADFRTLAPAFHTLRLANDAITTLLGAHQGQSGAIVAVGTGTIGVALSADGQQRIVGGWGFPSGDEGSGAWIGLQAINHVQHSLDGRADGGPMSAAIIRFCRDVANRDTNFSDGAQVLDWLSQADQAAYARLARIVVNEAHHDTAAQRILRDAAAAVALHISALDPQQQLPLALCGGLGATLKDYFPPALQQRIVPAQADSAHGALQLLSVQTPAFSSE
ncbi:glucosamine kinase [Herbaspirillum sp. Sphag1AN]|uniref:BadF/BadG/BcrA/BcrD ATPase family protein n=1 Tax=unclassified Herbaspirillum TaxID=2624150 RepID=UPI0016144D5F|nr:MULTISPECIES: BadF/BadG/BcrA/BcrD ATPase family protein [unclassified Herbaspirillum]MBB3212327.1 glucosamine kinase [Herbaspirillum sp. Sphag1AN]MBB3245575.1 glucosamine kinase [Herbaspirillum sp. Sphag64]